MHRGRGHIPELSYQQVRDLQQILIRRGYLTGEVDGKLGAATRAGVKAAQLKLGLPADSYPTPELLQRLHEQG
jgi:peptidoglycan hydrolase-like protein with peptidoglycan-binding domain